MFLTKNKMVQEDLAPSKNLIAYYIYKKRGNNMFIEMLAEKYALINENNMRLEYKGKITKVEVYEGGTDENLPHWVRIKIYKNNSED